MMMMTRMKALATASALSAALVAAPAHAGPLDFLKNAVKQELSELAQETTRGAVDAAVGKRKADKKATAASNEGGFRQEGGTTVPTADDVLAPQGETRSGVNVASGDVDGDGRAGKSGLSQNGTTVPSADTVQARQPERRAALIVPAIQKVAPEARPQRGRMVQNGTTVATAGEITAPEQPN